MYNLKILLTIQGLVIGGDGLAHSDDELAEAVTVPNAADESEETVELMKRLLMKMKQQQRNHQQ